MSNVIITLVASIYLGSIIGPMIGLGKQPIRCCKSPMILCRHNDTNTDIYLRRLSERLDKIYAQIDKTPYDDIFERKTKEEAENAEIIIINVFEQLRLLREGGLQTGNITEYMPDFLTNSTSKYFDYLRENIVCELTEKLNYTKEEAEQLRKELPSRDTSPSIIKFNAKHIIHRYSNALVRNELMLKVLEDNNYEIPQTHHLYVLFSKIENELIFKSRDISVNIYKAIEDDKVTDYWMLKDFICKSIADSKTNCKVS